MVRVSSSPLSASPPYFDENLHVLKSRPSRSWSKSPSEEIENEAPKKVDVCVSIVRIQSNIFATFFHSPEFSTFRRRISSYLWSRGLTRLPKIFSLKYNSFYKHVRIKHDDVNKGHTLPPVHGNYFIVPTEQGNEDSLQHSADLAVEEAHESGNLATVHETGIDPNELDDQMKTHACLFLEQ